MLVLSRAPSEKILFPNLGITLEILRIRGNRVRVGVQAPPHVAVLRHELADEPGLAPPEALTDPPANEPQLSHRQRNRLHTAQLALRLLQRQLEAGLAVDAERTLQKAIGEFDALDLELSSGRDQSQPTGTKRLRRALLVEDNANESELLSGYLRISGFEVDTAPDGREALEYLSRNRRPDLVLLDMHMPQLDGPGTITSIRNNSDLRGMKIFAVTGRSQLEAGVPIGPDGVDRWFRKPVNPEALVAEMKHDLGCATVSA